MTAEEVRAQIERLKRESLRARLAHIERTFPAVLHDARTFVEGTNACPWEVAVAFIGGEFATIKERYGVDSRSNRPRDPDLPPLTDLFYEACDLLYHRMTGEQP